MLFISTLKPNLSKQTDSIRVKVFSYSLHPFVLILRAKITLNTVICMIWYIFLDNWVMTTPKRRILALVFMFKEISFNKMTNWFYFRLVCLSVISTANIALTVITFSGVINYKHEVWPTHLYGLLSVCYADNLRHEPSVSWKKWYCIN